jgi:hypothetical protein
MLLAWYCDSAYGTAENPLCLLPQELETVVSDRDSLQRQLAAQSATHEAEKRQLHADKTGMQVIACPLSPVHSRPISLVQQMQI